MQSKPNTITVLLADDHPLALAGLHAIMAKAPDLQIVGEAENGDEVKELVANLQPDILILV